ncbi:MAG TPA: hypothetical protein VJH03_24775 [Blastocatellia bacterium]|nr:hypothetical protein [Blastocatellia bacterium]
MARLRYRPAVLIEFSVNFRSLRAGLNHSEERSYTAWLPAAGLAIDWDEPAVVLDDASRPAGQPDPNIAPPPRSYSLTEAEIDQYEADLIDKLVRSERLSIYYNPVFELFSPPGDALEDFLPRVAEAALARIEPELRRLRSIYELQLEQIREAHSARGSHAEELSFERLISHKLRFFESENRLAAMFSTMAGTVFGSTGPRADEEPYKPDEAELREDLACVEQEASDALRELYDEYLKLANEYDTFEIGLQPDNIQVIRRALLWVPVPPAEPQETPGEQSHL